MAADGGVHLDGDSGLIGPFDGLNGARPCAGKTSEGIVNLGSGTVERNAEANQACFLEFEDGLAGEQRRCAGRERDLDAFSGCVTDELKDIGALERIAAGEDEEGMCMSAI